MIPVDIDFARRPMWRRLPASRAARFLGVLALLLGLAAAGHAAWRARALGSELLRLDAQIARLDAARERQDAHRRAGEQASLTRAEVEAVNGAIRRLNFSWRNLLDTLEERTPARVALLAVEPDLRRAVVKIQAEASSPEVMLAYVEALGSTPFFRAAFLAKHETNERDAHKPVRFQVVARLKEAQ